MTTYVQSELDVLTGIATDPSPRATDDRAEIARAIAVIAPNVGNVFHIADLRREMGGDVPKCIGPVINRLHARKVISWVGWMPNGDNRARNGNKPAPVWRLKRRIESEDIA
jgi:hypothetical protein